jgi:multicomponent Na+:H+ antiporter subunit D
VDQLLPLTIAVPLLSAAGIIAAKPLLAGHRKVLDLVAILTAVAETTMLAVITARSYTRDEVYWFGGFRPAHGIAIGIDFETSALSAGLAALAAALVTAVLVFSWRYFEGVATYYHALMLLFLTGMAGFCLTGDIFDLFVWFELMGVAAYALTAYRPEERGSLQGALNFAITNSIGAYLSLSGIGLLYGRTGALNMAQIGAYLAKHPGGRLATVAFLLVIAGLLIKSAITPFHFWLADAHAVAPTPVCVLFSGVMVELGLYGIARIYWSVFAAGLGHQAAISHLLTALGALTAVTGALFCFRERHIKRLLAFSTISHSGMFLTGIAALSPLGLAGAAIYILGHAFIKGALFLCSGIVLHRVGSVNETWLHGRARHLKVTGVIFTLAGLGLADLPPFATFAGKTFTDTSAGQWSAIAFLLCAVLAGGAVLRVAGGVFYGLGDPPSEDPQMAAEASEETGETDRGRGHTPPTMLIPAGALVAAGIAAGLVPGLRLAVLRAAARFQDQPAYNARVLGGPASGAGRILPAAVTGADIGLGLASAAGAVLLALTALYWRRLPLLRRYGLEPGRGLTEPVRRFQSGLVSDYIAWMVAGLGALGAVLAITLH